MTWILLAFINGHPVAIDNLPSALACERLRVAIVKHYGKEAMRGRCFPVETH